MQYYGISIDDYYNQHYAKMYEVGEYFVDFIVKFLIKSCSAAKNWYLYIDYAETTNYKFQLIKIVIPIRHYWYENLLFWAKKYKTLIFINIIIRYQ